VLSNKLDEAILAEVCSFQRERETDCSCKSWKTKMYFSVVITVYQNDQIFLPRAMTCLLNQTFKEFEIMVMVDGETPLTRYDPHHICHKTLPAQVVYLPRSNSIGFRERHHSLQLASGEYIVWLNVDNLVYPNWLQNHYENTRQAPGGISVVNIQYWQRIDYWGVLPRTLAYGELDLLNYALPLELARRMGVFGQDTENIAHADWLAFERCAREAPVFWPREQSVCACHY
jgi:glycosyltransferase involved in cell wall biosynthesis